MTDFEHGVGVGMLLGGGKVKTGHFRAVMDDNTSTIKIVLENNGYSDNTYGYEYVDFSSDIVTNTTTAEGTTKKTQTFTQRIVTQLVNPNGELILGTEYNSDTGVITRYYDGADTDIHLTEWRTETVENMGMSTNADAAAVAWCIARNLEQSSSLKMQKKAYKDGLKQGIAGGADITEQYEQDGNGVNLTTDENGGISEPFIGNLTDGIYCVASDGSYVHMYLDMSYEDINGQGCITYDAYDANSNLLQTTQCVSNGNSPWVTRYGSVKWLNIDFSKSMRYAVWTRWIDDEGYTTSDYWDYPTGDAYNILKNAVQITNFPPETAN